ncbi:hypothetical protein GGQ54_002211 [Naumannella cuiyingiana]|uniref:Uncharacterized protein n=1 Tax=Naumannella cuiyingiana TaxID=1347891 RepID=A0A7Z0D9V5_9ACTN|nr:hypothetical protein [Naumannella cuiyingiana]NYI71651.1 hypothetical protein [Naumannella cuiyingiana]
MRNRHITGAVGASAALAAAAATFLMAPPAHAALVTYCSGTAENVTVPGDLVVRSGQSCTLTDVNVKGTVRVAKDANLVAQGGEFTGRVTVQASGYLDLTGASLGENVVSAAGYGVYLDSTKVAGNYTGRTVDGAADPGFFFLVGSQQSGNVTVSTGETLIENSTVGGNVASTDGAYTDVYNSVLSKNLTVTGNTDGGVVCASEVYGDARYDGNGKGLQIGGSGDLATCDGANFFGKNLTVSNTDGQAVVSDNIIAGKLSGTGNDPAPVGEGNRARGGVEGQFVDLAAPDASRAPSTSRMLRSETSDSVAQTAPAQTERLTEAKSSAKDRRAEATAEAKAAGKAF